MTHKELPFVLRNRFSNLTVLAVLVVLLALMPILVSIFSVKWSIIDDPSSYQVYQQIDQSLKRGNLFQFWNVISEKEGSRFRPFYNVYLYLTFFILDRNVLAHHVARLSIYAIVSFGFIKYLFKYSQDKILALMFGYIFMISPFVVENIVRLGPVEFIPLFLFLGLLFYYEKFIENRLNKQDLLIIWLLFEALFFTKEVFFIVVVPIWLVVSMQLIRRITLKRSAKFGSSFFLFLLFISSTVIFYLTIYLLNKNLIYNWQAGREVGQYKLSFDFIKSNFKGITGMFWHYSRLEVIILIISVSLTVCQLFNKNLRRLITRGNYLSLMWMTFFIFLAFLAIQIPWLYSLERYFIVVELFLIFASCLFLRYFLSLFKSYLTPKVYYIFYFSILALLLYIAYPQLILSNIYDYNFSKWYSGFTQFEFHYTGDLENIYQKSKYPVVYNFKNDIGNVEVFKTTGLYMELTSRDQVGSIQNLDDVCASKVNYMNFLLIIDRPGVPFKNLLRYKPVVSGEEYIPQINQPAFRYTWRIYTLTKNDACI